MITFIYIYHLIIYFYDDLLYTYNKKNTRFSRSKFLPQFLPLSFAVKFRDKVLPHRNKVFPYYYKTMTESYQPQVDDMFKNHDEFVNKIKGFARELGFIIR